MKKTIREKLPKQLSNLTARRTHAQALEEIQNVLANNGMRMHFFSHLYETPKLRYLEYITSPNYNPTWLKDETNPVFFDIETYYLPSDDDVKEFYTTGSTHYVSKQRMGAAVTADKDGNVKYWEEADALKLISYLLSFDEIIAYNGLIFDNYVLANYIDNEATKQELWNRSFDLMRVLSVEHEIGWDTKRKLQYFAEKYLNDGKLVREEVTENEDGQVTVLNQPNSKSVPKTLRTGTDHEILGVWLYCLKDVELIYRIYALLHVNEVKRTIYLESQLGYALTTLRDFSESFLNKLIEPIGVEIEQRKRAFDSQFSTELAELLEPLDEHMTGNAATYITFLLNDWEDIRARLPENDSGDFKEKAVRGLVNMVESRSLFRKFDQSQRNNLIPNLFKTTDILEYSEFQYYGSQISIARDGKTALIISHLTKNDLGKDAYPDIERVYYVTITANAKLDIAGNAKYSKFEESYLLESGLAVPCTSQNIKPMIDELIPVLVRLGEKYDAAQTDIYTEIRQRIESQYAPVIKNLITPDALMEKLQKLQYSYADWLDNE